jgi:hypothetical protein
VLVGLIGIVFERFLLRRFYTSDPILSLLVTFGLAMVAEQAIRMIWGAAPLPSSMPPEFKGNVVAVETAPFWDHDIAAAETKQGEYNDIVGTARTLNPDGTIDKERKWDSFWKPLGEPLPAERDWRFARAFLEKQYGRASSASSLAASATEAA